ncbi:MAG: hypothetical protein O3C40_04715, partial [Planctomycetota bacterium]|nr:hypothetical protein [Planctomycetota bacterium]
PAATVAAGSHHYFGQTFPAAHLMPEPFDPYLQWLEIEPHEMPVDHYRLLGTRRFESDQSVISAAADARMSHVRTFQTGPRAAYTQKLLNELAAARVCLLNSGAKASYDQVLEAVFFDSAPPPQIAQIACPPIADDDDTIEDLEEAESKTWVAVATVIIVLLVGAIAVLVLRQQKPHRTTVPANLSPASPIAVSVPDEPDYEESEPVLIYQEADGSVNLDAGIAQLHGPNLRLGISGSVNVITDWESMDDWVSWRFKVVKVPPQGIFHVHVTYAARPESDGGKFVIAVGVQEKVCEIRGTGEPVTDEYFIAVPNGGEHTLTVRANSKPSQRLMDLKSLNLVFP